MAIIVREWRMDALHDLYALGDPKEIIGRVDAMNEHNACVTALRAALAREVEAKQERRAFALELRNVQETLFTKLDELKAALADAARLREALRRQVVNIPVPSDGHATCKECGSIWEPGTPEPHARGCLAAKERI